MSTTKIEWADAVWNPITGCSPISAGCENCYAARMAKRLAGRVGYPADDPFKVTLHPERVDEPQYWRKPRTVFVCSMGDLFHEDVPFGFLSLLFGRMHSLRRHTFLVLTKRPQRMAEFIQWYREEWLGPFASAWPREYQHVWLGVTAENQAAADERIPLLLQTPAARRFVSCEPLLGPVELDNICTARSARSSEYMNALSLEEWTEAEAREECGESFMPPLDWVIAGGETGPGARPMHPDWVRGLRDQCKAAAVPFFFKAWGDWVVPEDGARACRVCGCTEHMPCEGLLGEPCLWVEKDLCSACVGKPIPKGDRPVKHLRVGKARAGRRLDGREWNEVPER